MDVDKRNPYEVHRPKALENSEGLRAMRARMGAVEWRRFSRAKERAGTAGPLMIGERISQLTGEQVNELFWAGLTEGANPCYVDETSGHVMVGHFEFVPAVTEFPRE